LGILIFSVPSGLVSNTFLTVLLFSSYEGNKTTI
jgi:hypothetical protein